MAKSKGLSGFVEWLPEQQVVADAFVATVRRAFELHGFAHLDLRSLRTSFDDPTRDRLRHLTVASLKSWGIDDPLAWFVRDASAARSAVLVALRTQSSLHSLFVVGFHQPHQVTEEHVGLVESVAPLLSRAVRRVLIVEHEREATRRLAEIDLLRQQLLDQLAATGQRET